VEKLYAKFYRVQTKLRHNASLVDCVKVYNMVVTLKSMVGYFDESMLEEDHPLRVRFLDVLKQDLGDF